MQSPAGKPDVMYFIPESVDAQDYVTPVDMDEIEIVEDYGGSVVF